VEDLLAFLLNEGIKQDVDKAIQNRITVQDVIREAIGKKLDTHLSDLADRLSDRLLATTDFIMIRWYFLQHWLPKLGHNAAMFILLLRNSCYFLDPRHEFSHDPVQLQSIHRI